MTGRLDQDRAEALRAACLRVYGRYVTEVVEALQLCPWARRARQEGRVRPSVMLEARPTPAQVLCHLDEVFVDRAVDIGLVLLPLGTWSRREFRRFVEEVRAGHAAIHRNREVRGPPSFAMADFHPDAAPDTSSAARLVSFIRRSPDPTIQVVRRTALDAVRGPEGQGTRYLSAEVLRRGPPAEAPVEAPLHRRVAEANLTMIERFGAERLAAVLDDIRADRDRAYASILGSAAP